jgi:hypothetical protein
MVFMDNDIHARKELEQTLLQAAEGLSSVSGDEFFRALMLNLSAMGIRKTNAAFWGIVSTAKVADHYCWPTDLDGPAKLQPSQMLKVHQALDRGIAQIKAAAGHDAALIVISGAGVGPNHAGWHLLPDILTRLGYLGSASAGSAGSSGPPPAKKLDPVKDLRDLLPKGFRKNLARMLPTGLHDKLAQRVDAADIDWQNMWAYWLPTDLEGYIRINLEGREPMGVVEPGAAYRAGTVGARNGAASAFRSGYRETHRTRSHPYR